MENEPKKDKIGNSLRESTSVWVMTTFTNQLKTPFSAVFLFSQKIDEKYIKSKKLETAKKYFDQLLGASSTQMLVETQHQAMGVGICQWW